MSRVPSVVALGVLALGVTGCSGSTPPADVSGGAAALSASASGASTTGTSGGSALDGDVMAARVRSAMAAAGSARFSLESSTTSGQDAQGVLNFSGTSIRVSLNFSDGTDQLRVISFPGVLYADVGQVVDGKHWLKVTATATDPVSTAMEPLLSYMTNSADISSQAGSWSAAGGFTTAGRTTIGGVAVTEYDATVPQAAVQANLPAQFREVMQKDITGDSKLRLWLDAKGRPLQLITPGSYDNKPDLVTVQYTDWGSAPAIAAPDAKDVVTPNG